MASLANQLDVLYEDNHLLVINKRAMLPTMGVADDKPSLIKLAKEYIRNKYQKPGNVYLGVVSRLDAPVTGVTLLARTSKAAARLSASFRDRKAKKIYWAVVAGELPDATGILEHYLRKDERHRKVHVTHADCPDAQLARLQYQVLKVAEDRSLLRIELETGRKHQIRVQLAKLGFPVVGDKKYGSQRKFSLGIALHSRELEIDHPTQHKTLTLVAPPPKYWPTEPGFAGLF